MQGGTGLPSFLLNPLTPLPRPREAGRPGSLGAGVCDRKTHLHRCLRELSFPQKGGKGTFPSPFVDSLSFGFSPMREHSAGHIEATLHRHWERGPGLSYRLRDAPGRNAETEQQLEELSGC